MGNDVAAHAENEVVTLMGEDGRHYQCQVFDVFNFESRDYALLLKLGQPDDDARALVVMRMIEQDERPVFQTIANDDEFDRVVAYIEEQADKNETVTKH